MLVTRALPFILMSFVAAAAPPNKQVLECVKASETAQTARDELHYDVARDALAKCTASACPPLVQTDCAKWLAQLDLDQPSVVIVTTVDGADATEGFQVAIDERALTSFRPGQPLRIDPGARRVTVTLLDGRKLTEKLVMNVGERNRRVTFSFVKVSQPVAEVPVPAKPAVEASLTKPERAAPVVPLLLTGGTVVSVATFSLLGVLGNGALSPVLADPCASTRSCDPSRTQPAGDLYLGANIALGAAALFAALAVWQWIAWGTSGP